ncbi:septum site-determining protein MinC [Paenibacillus thermoaerophilus]|uniref:Probable septum site-determining protein MinC n=1 Tax=Paenibacillus thermoaerophilus TaxID=1215385 RepID=A0ABW2UWW3_9BACL|nr:septum site-determining protein MinC [Paenibacillus thermoaerophilus]TMV17283.1 septum site-determining protein MinC [Paenibacillus thermoaerophilus]
MAAVRHHVTIKGVKDGLVFLMNEHCEFNALLEELETKLSKTHHKLLSGPLVHVHVKFGKRKVKEADKDKVLELIRRQGNLMVKTVEFEPAELPDRNRLLTLRGMIRSGQTIEETGSVLFLGDINPGGTLRATGDIYVLGALRGTAHAGSDGDETAVIAASYMQPTQLRIAEVVSRPPDEWGVTDTYMEFAYVKDGRMEIDKMSQLHRIRPKNPF